METTRARDDGRRTPPAESSSAATAEMAAAAVPPHARMVGASGRALAWKNGRAPSSRPSPRGRPTGVQPQPRSRAPQLRGHQPLAGEEPRGRR
ncbi:unnamed protein product [Urochloa humidicola]